MPLYDMKCNECGECSEVMCKYSELDEQSCPECGSELERVVSTTNFSLKGKDWPGRDIRRTNEFNKKTNR